MNSTNKIDNKGEHDNQATHPNKLQSSQGNSKETAIDLELEFEGNCVQQEAVIGDRKDTKVQLKPSIKQLKEWTHLVKKGMIRAPCTYCQTTDTAVLPFSVFIQNGYKDEVTILELKECAQDGSTRLVSIFGKAWRNPGLRNPLSRFRKHLEVVHGLSKEELPDAVSMKNQSTGLTDNKIDLRAYKLKWRQMRQLKVKEYTRRNKKKRQTRQLKIMEYTSRYKKNTKECAQAAAETPEVGSTSAYSQDATVAAQLRTTSWSIGLSQEEDNVAKKLISAKACIPISVPFVSRKSLASLAPGIWLNDEVIVGYFTLLLKRDEILCEQTSGRRRSHIYRTNFFGRLTNQDHLEDDICDRFQYSGVKNWAKNVPGQDIFSLDKIFFPMNDSKMHWNVAVAYMQEHRIEMYCSIGDKEIKQLRLLMRYIHDEHQEKKGVPLPDEKSWTLIPCQPNTPHQRNSKFSVNPKFTSHRKQISLSFQKGFDCGVYTCLYVDFLLINNPLVFTQEDLFSVRKRLALSVVDGKLHL
jgi:hypothetical protein